MRDTVERRERLQEKWIEILHRNSHVEAKRGCPEEERPRAWRSNEIISSRGVARLIPTRRAKKSDWTGGRGIWAIDRARRRSARTEDCGPREENENKYFPVPGVFVLGFCSVYNRDKYSGCSRPSVGLFRLGRLVRLLPEKSPPRSANSFSNENARFNFWRTMFGSRRAVVRRFSFTLKKRVRRLVVSMRFRYSLYGSRAIFARTTERVSVRNLEMPGSTIKSHVHTSSARSPKDIVFMPLVRYGRRNASPLAEETHTTFDVFYRKCVFSLRLCTIVPCKHTRNFDDIITIGYIVYKSVCRFTRFRFRSPPWYVTSRKID